MHTGDDDRRIRRGVFDLAQLVGSRDRLTLDRSEPVAGLETGSRRRRVRDNPRDLAHVIVELRQAETGEQENRDHEVGRGPGGEDQDPLPGRLVVEAARVLEITRLHPAHPHVSDHGDGPDGVEGASACRRPELGAGTDRELDHPHLEELGQGEVARLVGCDQEQEHAGDGDDYQEGFHAALRLPSFP